MHRLREWDAVVVADAPGLDGDEHEVVVLREDDAHPFARALAGELAPPYRARGVRKDGVRWAVGARAFGVAELPGVDGDELTLTVREGARSLVVDGRPTLHRLDVVEGAAGGRFESYFLEARRLEDELWEVEISPL